MGHSDDTSVGENAERLVVAFTLSDGADRAVEADVEHRFHAVAVSEEEDRAAVGRPSEFLDRVVPVGCEVGFFRSLHVEDKQTVFVGFISVVLHAEPCEAVAVGREGRHGVVACHAFGEVAGLLCIEIIGIEVAVGGHGIFKAGLFTRYIDEGLAVGRPCE